MDEDRTLWGQFLNAIAVPLGLLLLVPLALLFVLWFYIAAVAEAARMLVLAPFKKAPPIAEGSPVQKPHYASLSSGAQAKRMD